MTITVSDHRSNPNEQIAAIVSIIGRSNILLKIFTAIYYGKKKIKSKSEIAKVTGLSEKEVVDKARAFVANNFVKSYKLSGITVYEKDDFVSNNKNKIINLVGNKKKFKEFPTKRNLKIIGATTIIRASIPKKFIKAKQLTIEDFEQFKKMKKVKKKNVMIPIDEKEFKELIKNIIDEKGKFTDWGGEKNDLYTTRLRLDSRRVPAAFAFKGKGKKGILKPSMMGKNGDQILRLFQCDAEVFILQYWEQISQAVYETMYMFAIAKSALDNKVIYYAVIDGYDTARIIETFKQ